MVPDSRKDRLSGKTKKTKKQLQGELSSLRVEVEKLKDMSLKNAVIMQALLRVLQGKDLITTDEFKDALSVLKAEAIGMAHGDFTDILSSES